MAAIGLGGGVKVICKKCGKPATASEFILDPVFRMMVCPACFRARRDGKPIEQKKSEEEKQQEKVDEIKNYPPGWDSEDEYLERMARAKKEQVIIVKRIDQNRVRYTCKKCGFAFAYNTSTKMPRVCQYCGRPVDTNFEEE